jgi:hypothetical protein
MLKAQKLSWFGHINRMPEISIVKKIYKWKPITSRPVGRPKYRWEDDVRSDLTFQNRASYIWDGRTATLQMLHFMYIFSTNTSTKYFKHAAHSPFFSSKCSLFHNATFFCSCIIHILHTEFAKI